MIYTTSKATFHMKAFTNTAGTLVATDYKDPPTVMRGGVQRHGYSC